MKNQKFIMFSCLLNLICFNSFADKSTLEDQWPEPQEEEEVVARNAPTCIDRWRIVSES